MVKMMELELQRLIKIKNNYAQLIVDLGFDYDGLNNKNDLKKLIDELVNYAKDIINNNDKKAIYIDGNNKKYNILHEEIGEDNGIYK